MDPIARKEDFEKSAHEYWRWTLSAEDLLITANILEEKYTAAVESIKHHKGGKLPLEFQVLAPMIYFKAKSLELFLKAIYIKEGNKVIKNGKFIYVTHDLNLLSKNVKLVFSAEEEKLLNKLSTCIIYWGTYPVPVNERDWRPDTEGITGIQPIYSWSGNDDKNYLSVLRVVREKSALPEDKNIPTAFTKFP